MRFDPIRLRVLAERKEDENWGFRQFLKQRCELDADELDTRVFELTKRVWAGIDCTACAICCKPVRPTLSDEEVDRLALRLGFERTRFIETFLVPTDADDDKPWQTQQAPCPFLTDNRCSVYEDRPADCSGYPYLYEPQFVSRLMGVIERTFTCPIVYEVMEELKRSVGYRHRRRS
jgi:Fe-S-cluster containining protein